MALPALFETVLIVGNSGITTALATLSGYRLGDRRFLFVSAANGGMVALGAVWTWGELPVSPPAWSVAQLPVLLLVLLIALLFLVSTLWPRPT